MSVKPMTNKTNRLFASLPIVLLGLIVGWGVWIRFYQFGAVPVGTYWDETAMLADAKSVASQGVDLHGRPWYQILYPSYGDYKQPVYIWLASYMVKILGVNALALRLPSAIAGVGTVVVVALLAVRLFSQHDRRVWLWAGATVVLTSPWAILFSRTGFEGHVGQFLLASSVLVAIWKPKSWPWLMTSAIIGALATYTYFSVRFVWPVVFVTVMVFSVISDWWMTKNHRVLVKNTVLTLLLPLVVFSICLWPMFKSPLYQDSNSFRLGTASILNDTDYAVLSNTYRELTGNTIFSRVFYHRHWLLIRELIINIADHLDLGYIFVTGDDNLRHGTGQHGLFLWPMLIPFLVGLWQLTRFPKQGVIIFVWWLTALIPAAVPNTTPHALRSLNALAPISLIMTLGLVSGWQWLITAKLTYSKIFLSGSWVIIVLFSLWQFSWHYFTIYPTQSAPEWHAVYSDIVSAAAPYWEQQSVVYIIPFEERFYLWLFISELISVSDIQSATSVAFQFPEYGKVKKLPSDWETVFSSQDRVMIIGSQERLTELAEISTSSQLVTVSSNWQPDDFGLLLVNQR